MPFLGVFRADGDHAVADMLPPQARKIAASQAGVRGKIKA